MPRPGLGSQRFPGGGRACIGKGVFKIDEGPEELLPNTERFEQFLEVGQVPYEVRGIAGRQRSSVSNPGNENLGLQGSAVSGRATTSVRFV